MALTGRASTHWEGSLIEGKGIVTLDTSKAGSFDVNWRARSTSELSLTSPEELIAAAHATCFSMALAHALAGNGNPPTALDTAAGVEFVPGVGITGVRLTVRAVVPGLSAEDFAEFAREAKEQCPVSLAMNALPISLDAELIARRQRD